MNPYQLGTTGKGRGIGELTGIMPSCDHCGSYVSNEFKRVFADDRGYILACPACSSTAGIGETARHRAPEA